MRVVTNVGASLVTTMRSPATTRDTCSYVSGTSPRACRYNVGASSVARGDILQLRFRHVPWARRYNVGSSSVAVDIQREM